MPIYRYECNTCRSRFSDLLKLDAPNPACKCGGETTKLMPRRVVGRVMPDSNGVHTGSGFACSSPAADEPETLAAVAGEMPTAMELPAITGDPKLHMPWKTNFAKDYADCAADERDARWHDTAQAMTQWQADCLASGGVDYSAALAQASQTQQQVVAQSRSEMQRADGLT